MEIEGKRILITGANRGLGRALALACAEAGAGEVVAGARRPEELETLVNSADARAARERLTIADGHALDASENRDGD